MSNTTRMVDTARDILRNSGYFVENLWHVKDIHFICEQNELPTLTDSEAMDIFTIAHAQFDGENGLSWPQLEKAVNTYLLKKALLEGLCNAKTA